MDEHLVEIVLVEDNPADEELVLHGFKRHHLAEQVRVARDGAEALDLIFGRGAYSGQVHKGPRIILLDLNLPKVSGLDVLREVKSDPRTRAIPVVVMTGSREEQDMVRSYQLGANSYIVKPINYQDFSEAVGELALYWMLLNKMPGR